MPLSLFDELFNLLLVEPMPQFARLCDDVGLSIGMEDSLNMELDAIYQ